jgi:hypothetical protein
VWRVRHRVQSEQHFSAQMHAHTMEQSRFRVACATICLVEAVLCAYASASMKERILSSVVTMAGRYVTVIM